MLSRHENRCSYNPQIATQILEFIKGGKLTFSDYSEFRKGKTLPKATTIITQADKDNWSDAIVKLLLDFYQNGLIDDFEEYDFAIGKLTDYIYGYSNDYWVRSKHHFEFEREITPNFNNSSYYKLLKAIIAQAIDDAYLRGLSTEKDKDYSKQEAYRFLAEFCPEIYDILSVMTKKQIKEFRRKLWSDFNDE